MSLDLEHSGPAAPSADPTALLAEWLERRLDATTDWCLDEARLYGVTIRDQAGLVDDDDGAARYCLLDRGYPYDVVEGPAVMLGANFDALALLTFGWQAPMPPTGEPEEVRPSRHPARQRVRIVALVRIDPTPDVSALSTVLRLRSTGAVQVVADGEGRMADAMRCLAAEAHASASR